MPTSIRRTGPPVVAGPLGNPQQVDVDDAAPWWPRTLLTVGGRRDGLVRPRSLGGAR